MKLNWGTGIAIFYISFMIVMIAFVVKSRSYDHSLVVDNYYEEDLKYQQHYNKLVNAQDEDSNFEYKYFPKEKTIKLKFPSQASVAEGEVLFYRPSDSRLDFKVPLKLDAENTMLVATGKLPKGRWEMKCNWSIGDKDYYKKVDLYF